jgi:hypothetical protein
VRIGRAGRSFLKMTLFMQSKAMDNDQNIYKTPRDIHQSWPIKKYAMEIDIPVEMTPNTKTNSSSKALLVRLSYAPRNQKIKK